MKNETKQEPEVWKAHPEFDFIEASTWGRVRTIDRVVSNGKGARVVKGQILKQHLQKSGYMQVSFRVNGKRVTKYVHRLVAQTFIPNPNGFPQVNHKDCNRANNNVFNIEWVTREENIAYRDKLGHTARNNSPKKPVYAVNLKTHEVLWLESQMKASRELSIGHEHINKVIKGKRNHTGGWWFVNANENAVSLTRFKFGDGIADRVAELTAKPQ